MHSHSRSATNVLTDANNVKSENSVQAELAGPQVQPNCQLTSPIPGLTPIHHIMVSCFLDDVNSARLCFQSSCLFQVAQSCQVFQVANSKHFLVYSSQVASSTASRGRRQTPESRTNTSAWRFPEEEKRPRCLAKSHLWTSMWKNQPFVC